MIRIAVLMTCFNRREKTLACLEALFGSDGLAEIDLRVFLVDDASTDGTAAAVRERFSQVCVINGNGSLFWCRGMHRAFVEAMSDAQAWDHLLWLNDDTTLYPDALMRLLACERALVARGDAPAIVVGTALDPATGRPSYGGEIRVSRWRPLRFVRVEATDAPVACDSMNGNMVLVSRAAYMRVGNLDAAFEHAMGDTDYALRATRARVRIWAAPGTHGTCSHNPVTGTFFDANAGLRVRWKNALSRKGLPWRSWLLMCWRHGGWLWPALFVWPYAKIVMARYGRPCND